MSAEVEATMRIIRTAVGTRQPPAVVDAVVAVLSGQMGLRRAAKMAGTHKTTIARAVNRVRRAAER